MSIKAISGLIITGLRSLQHPARACTSSLHTLSMAEMVAQYLFNHSHEIKAIFNPLLNESLFLGAGAITSYSSERSEQGAGV